MGPTSPSSTRAGLDRGVDPPPLPRGLRRQAPLSEGAADRHPHTLSEETGPSSATGDRRARPRPHAAARASRSASGSSSAGVSWARTASRCGAGPAGRGLAGERRGRYAHSVDDHDAPLDPNFSGGGRCLTGDDGEYRFVTIKPGAYPWPNHPNAWRPNHIHFSLFGRAFTERLVTQMYFPAIRCSSSILIFNSIRDERARERLISRFDLELTKPDWALGYRFDIVVGGRDSTPFEEPHAGLRRSA